MIAIPMHSSRVFRVKLIGRLFYEVWKFKKPYDFLPISTIKYYHNFTLFITYIPVVQSCPVHPSLQLQLLGLVQVPPLWHPSSQIAIKCVYMCIYNTQYMWWLINLFMLLPQYQESQFVHVTGKLRVYIHTHVRKHMYTKHYQYNYCMCFMTIAVICMHDWRV